MASLARALHSTMPRHRWLLAALALAFACPGDEPVPSGPGTTTGTTTAVATTSVPTTSLGVSESGNPTSTLDPTTADSTGAPPLDACACAGPSEISGCNDIDEWVPGCPSAEPCPTV